VSEDGRCNADSLGDVIAYLESVEYYLGKLYREKAEEDFTDVITHGWIQVEERVRLVGTWQLEMKAKDRVTQRLLDKAVWLEEEKTKAEKSMQANASFFNSMSQKVKTPLNGIVGSATLLQECAVDSRQKELCDLLLRSAQSLNHTFNDIVDHMQIEVGNFKLHPEPFDIVEMMGEVDRLLKPIAEDQGLSLTFQIEKGMPRFLIGGCDSYPASAHQSYSLWFEVHRRGGASVFC